jgi:hypothetical protein
MGSFLKTIVVLSLTFAMMPGVFEVLENSAHLVQEGHLAHAKSADDHHDPASPEHGCTPTLHLCGCHASLTFLVPQFTLPPSLAAHSSRAAVDRDLPLSQFAARLERPPQV